MLDPDVQVGVRRQDGERCAPGDIVAEVAGAARTLLVGERTALNFLQRLSGIATSARRFVDAAAGRIVVLDTRKTTPACARSRSTRFAPGAPRITASGCSTRF